ncbi:MAG: DUF6702 family protein [Sphingomonadales bacterium]
MQAVLALFLWSIIPVVSGPVAGVDPLKTHPINATHPFHVSVTEINHNTSARTLEIQCKFFSDDFEVALKSAFNQKADLSNPAMQERMDSLVSRYVRLYLQLRVNGKPIELQYLGFEQEREATYVYFESSNITTSIRSMECGARLLYESFSDQVNIFHVTTAAGKKSTKLDYPATSVLLNFE